jgi:hypothetical protein
MIKPLALPLAQLYFSEPGPIIKSFENDKRRRGNLSLDTADVCCCYCNYLKKYAAIISSFSAGGNNGVMTQ